MGRDCSLPVVELIDGYSRSVVRLVGFSTMALAAELRRLVGARGAAGRVVGRVDEEHGRIETSRLAGVPGVHVDHVHDVLVVAAGAAHNRFVVVGGEAHEEPVVLHELGGIRAGHRDYAGGLAAVPVPRGAAGNGSVEAHGVIVEIVAGRVAVFSE